MKVKINKKNLIFLGIFLPLIILVFATIFLSTYGVTNNLFLLNKYTVLKKHCETNSKLTSIKFDCTALIDKYEDIGKGMECFTISLVTRDTNLEELKVCEKKGVINWDKDNLISEKRVPIYMQFEYWGIPILPYFFREASFTLMSDTSISLLEKALIDKGISNINIYSKGTLDIDEKGYYISNDLEIVEGKSLQRVIFFTNRILEITTEGDNIFLNIETELLGRKHNLQLSSKAFVYTPNILAKSSKITSTSIDEIDLTKEYQIAFLYFPTGSNLTKDEISIFCNNAEKGLVGESMCERLEVSPIENMGIDIDKYIDEEITNSNDEKLTFGNLIFYSLLLTND